MLNNVCNFLLDKTHNVKEIFCAEKGPPFAPNRPSTMRIITEKVKILDMPKEGRRHAAVGRYYGVNELPVRCIKEHGKDTSTTAIISSYEDAKRVPICL